MRIKFNHRWSRDELASCIAVILDELSSEYGVAYYTGVSLYLHTEDSAKNAIVITGEHGERVRLEVSHPDTAHNRKGRKKRATVLDFAKARAARQQPDG